MLETDSRGYGKLAMQRNVRRATQHYATHNIGRKANSEVSFLYLQSDPGDPDHAEIARLRKYVLFYGPKWIEQPKIQREIWKDAALWIGERSGAKALCANLLNTTFARRLVTKGERVVEAGDISISASRGISVKFRSLFPE